MIMSFACKDAEQLFMQGRNRRFAAIARPALRRLNILNAVVSLEELRASPGNRLEALFGDRAGQHSIRVNDKWRICFIWKDGHVHDVTIVDYH
ncbi:MAG: type II toxin-antitoxin system RelE/ParE family toxin [Candidatus Adiutrix sp.]|jgi:proteic killer suppression protein|nr:type II toxin-antitoxin system RelE/ParE family toxin [Candidatus Adiutrix sp.]